MDCVTHPIDEWDGPNNKLPRRTSNEYGLSGLDSHTWTLFLYQLLTLLKTLIYLIKKTMKNLLNILLDARTEGDNPFVTEKVC